MLDESLDILTAAWSGEPVRHRGEHYTVDGGTAAQPYDVVAALPPGSDPAPYAAAGATWQPIR